MLRAGAIIVGMALGLSILALAYYVSETYYWRGSVELKRVRTSRGVEVYGASRDFMRRYDLSEEETLKLMEE